MSQSPEARTPDGGEEAVSVEVGEPVRIEDPLRGSQEDQPRPNLDQREERISTTRKPMGPPIEEDTPSLEESRPRENPEGPTDPS